MATEIGDPYDFDLTPQTAAALQIDTLIPGETVTWRFQARRGGAAQSLASTILVLSVRRKDTIDPADLVLTRKSNVQLVGAAVGVMQIQADADQTTEDIEAETGKGWYEVRFAPGDEAALEVLLGSRMFYDLRVKFTADGTVRTLLRGRFEVTRERTKVAVLI